MTLGRRLVRPPRRRTPASASPP